MTPDKFAADDAFKNIRSHSPEDVFAAGGTTAFGLKMRKNKVDQII